MGLDVTYCKGLQSIDREDSTPESIDVRYLGHNSPAFADHASDILPGYYLLLNDGGFRAGSYSGYNSWRSLLCQMANGCDNAARPINGWDYFDKLIYFSDCDGTIGSTVARELLREFVEFDERAKEFAAQLPDGVRWKENWYEWYQKWHVAFEYAAQGGVVLFR